MTVNFFVQTSLNIHITSLMGRNYINCVVIMLLLCLFDVFSIFVLSESDCILHGYIKKLGGPWTSSWQMRYAKLYPNRLELHPDSAKPELLFMDQVEEVNPELTQVKNEQCIVIRLRDGRIVLTNPVSKKKHVHLLVLSIFVTSLTFLEF